MKKKNIRYYKTTAPSFKFYVVCIFTFTTSLLGASTFIRSFQSRPSTSAGRAHPYFTFADKFKRNKTFAGIKPKKNEPSKLCTLPAIVWTAITLDGSHAAAISNSRINGYLENSKPPHIRISQF